MPISREAVTVTTDSSGAATAYSSVLNGFLYRIKIVDTDMAAGAVDYTITSEDSGDTLLAITNTEDADKYPRQPVDTTAGVAISDSFEKIPLNNERVKIVVAQGGDTKSATVTIYWEF